MLHSFAVTYLMRAQTGTTRPEQVFGHLKDEFYRGRVFDSYEQFKRELDAYIVHWNTRRRQIRLEGRTPEEFRSMSLAV